MNKRIKICHIVNRLDTGGMENGVVNLCNHLDRKEFEPSICFVKGLGTMVQRLNPDVKNFNLGFNEGLDPFRFLSLMNFFKDKKPDIVHTHAWGACSFDGIIGAKMANVPVIINGEHGTFFLKKQQVILQRILAMLCDTTLSVSEFLKQEIVRNLGIPKTRIRVIANGVAVDIFNGKYDVKKEIKDFWDEKFNQKIVIGCIGSLKPIKNQLMLLESLNLMLTEKPDANVSVVFIGDGPDIAMLNEYVLKNKLTKNAFFLGRREDVPELLSVIDIVVSTSKSEGAPNVLLETMASGIPVIATNSGGANEYLVEGKNGYLIEQNDIKSLKEKIQLLMNPDKRKIMGEFARNFVMQNYSIEKMVEQYSNLYHDLYAKKVCR